MSASLLTTKLYMPPASPRLVSRPRLIRQLDEGLHLNQRLTLVSAPAGFGKTTLLSDWLRHAERPVAWLSLDDGDNDPLRFSAYLLAALQSIDPKIGQSAATILQSPQPPDLESLTTSLVNDFAETQQQLILVLDDYHLIDAGPIHEMLSFLLDHMPPPSKGLHLVIATRADPPLPVARLRARGQLNELHVADLRFTTEEAAEFLNQVMGLDLSAEDLSAMEARTEGWIAGLQMAAVSMRGRADVSAFVQAFTGSHRYIFDYLGDEVLRQQPDDVRQFLLQTAILDRLTAPLCEAVRFGLAESPSTPVGDAVVEGAGPDPEPVGSQAMLEYLESNNLFILPLDDKRRWYRYHHLFADLLRQRLQWEQPELEPELHRRASEWYEEHGLIPEAVSHALASGNLERAADLIEWTAWTTLARGEIGTLRSWLDRLPSELTRSRPQLGVLYAWALAYGGDLERIEPHLQSVDVQQVPGEVAALRAYVASLHDELPRATELAHQVFEYLPERKWYSRGIAAVILGMAPLSSGDPAAAIQTLTEAVQMNQAAGHTHLAAIAVTMLGEALQMQGRLREAAETHRQALRLASEKGNLPAPFAGLAHVGLSRQLYEWNDLEGAAHQAEQGIELCRLGGLVEAIPAGCFILSQIHLARGQPDQAVQMIEETARAAQRAGNDYVLARAAALRMRLWMTHHDRVPASHWMGQLLPDTGGGTSYLRELIHLAQVRELMASAVLATPVHKDRVRKTLELLRCLLPAAKAAGRVENTIEILVLQAVALQLLEHAEQASSALRHALSLAEPEGYVRTFVDEGEPMARLLRRALAKGIAPDYVQKLLAAFEESAQPLPPATQAPVDQPLVDQPLVDPLTEREMEVLRLIAAGLSNREIAQELVVAVSTVKSHINHIYGKLDAKSRTQAVAKAHGLNLL
jgi:LuxR family maltose regulon positive regulatory protein